MDKAILTCAVTGVLTDPNRFPVPVSPEEMANSCREAYDAGASIMHVHFRRQEPNMGRFPSWEPSLAQTICDAIRQACPGVIINMSTGVVGGDVSGPIACMDVVQPEFSACNAGTLNYLKIRSNGQWAWPPMIFDNDVNKIGKMLKAMKKNNSQPEMECFDTGIVRSVAMYVAAGMCEEPHYNLVMGVPSGMPADSSLLPLLLKYVPPNTHWQVTAIGRSEIWDLHRSTAELGGMLRTGLEDTFYLPNGDKARGNGDLIDALADCARGAGRSIATPTEARELLELPN